MTLRTWLGCGIVLLLLCSGSLGLLAQTPPDASAKAASTMPSVVTVPPEAQASPTFNAEAATNAY